MKNILLIRLSSLGDIVMTTPAIRALKNRYPDSRIDFVVYDRFAASLAHHPDIDRLFLLPKKRLKEHLARREFGSFWDTFRAFIVDLRSSRYDYVIDMHNVTDSALVALVARGKTKVGHKKQLLSLPFSVRSTFDIGSATTKTHSVETNLQFLVDAGCLAPADSPETPKLEYTSPESARSEINDYLTRQDIQDKVLVGINPCASYHYRRWGADRFAAVADFLVKNYGCTILLFGSPSEQPIVAEVMSAMQSSAIDTSSLTLYQAFELIRRLKLFVTNNSAPMHIAAALGTPLVTLHGSINVHKFSPLGDVARDITKDLPCLPCKDMGASCQSRLCFEQVTVEEVCEVCRELLASLPGVSP